MQWTNQQQSAIESRDKNLLVAAAAGSGKTAVLVERIIQMVLEDNLDVDKMLIVTFTNPAAQEMRSRIHKKIFERMSIETDSEKLWRLERQSILLSGASIMTFHAFCLSVLRRNFSKINFDPKFREAGEQELNILKQEVIEKLFEDKYADDAAFAQFADDFDGNVYGDKNLYDIIFNLYDFSQSRPYPEQWLKSIVTFYENPDAAQIENGQNWFDFMINFALKRSKHIVEDVLKKCAEIKKTAAAQVIVDSSATPKDLATYKKNWETVIQTFESDYKIIDALRERLDDWDKLCDIQAKFEVYTRVSKLPADLKVLKVKFKEVRDDYKDAINKLRELVYMKRADIFAQITGLTESVRKLSAVTIEFGKAFSAAKRERGIIDFDDMEHLALEIFNADSATAESYRQKFQVIMVDEYQDTNGVQEEIISKILGDRNFFAVGDVKQSIYRFRNADPEIFMRKYDAYPKSDDSERIDLSANFRSRRQVVDAVNAFFRRVMTKAAMEIDYNTDAELNFHANYPAAANTFDEPAEFYIINSDNTAEKSDDDDKPADDSKAKDTAPSADELDELGLEIQIIADKINAMIKAEKKVWDGDKYRPMTFKDVVILIRAISGRASKIVDVLQKNKIPAYAADDSGYFRAPEILTTLSLLSILDNARQDIPLAAVMLSPIGGFSEQDLATLRLSDKTADLYTLVENFYADDELSARCREFLNKLKDWRETSRQVGVPELLSKIYRETGYYDYFGTKIDGRVAQANLRMLIDRAAEFESTAFRGLSRFIQFIKKIRELENDLAAARTLGENEDVVRVMTIHKSKGLEFPVVFVAQLGKKFNFQDTRSTVLTHKDLGVGIYGANESPLGLTRVEPFVRKIISRKIKDEALAEELRILYVAFTRAREKLILIGTVKNDKALYKYKNISADEKIPAATLQDAERPMDWLLMTLETVKQVTKFQTLAKTEIKVGAEELPVAETKKDAETKKGVTAPEVAEDSPLATIPAKLSVTELKRRIAEYETEMVASLSKISKKKFDTARLYRRPNFMQKTDISAAEFGTLMHSVMQHLNLTGTLDSADISAQIDKMISAQIFTDEQGAAVKKRVGNIEKFFASSIGQRLINAAEIYRELPFNQNIDAGTINAGENFRNAAGEKIFVQGIIDLLFKDSTTGKWVLLDYKTDRDNDDEHFRREYKEQIRLYVQAVETLTAIKISEKYLYLLGAGRLISM